MEAAHKDSDKGVPGNGRRGLGECTDCGIASCPGDDFEEFVHGNGEDPEIKKRIEGSEDFPDEPLHQTLFQIEYNLCKEFPAMTPMQIDDMTFHDVIRLFSKVRAIQVRDEEIHDILTNPKRVIYRPAGDDWF
jgi:hypothetical protein